MDHYYTASETTITRDPPDKSDEEGPIDMEGVESQEQPGNDDVAMAEQNDRPDEDNSSDGKEGSEKEESSSSDGKGASGGSGGGYQADDDCSSSESSVGKNGDGSSGEASNRQAGSRTDDKPAARDTKVASMPSSQHSEGDRYLNGAAAHENDPNRTSASDSGHLSSNQHCHAHHHNHHHRPNGQHSLQNHVPLPQWNGIRIQHPMDPRIDLSSVGFLGASNLLLHNQNFSGSHLAALMKHPPPVAAATTASAASALHASSHNQMTSVNNPDLMAGEAPSMFPSFEQYMKLMEVIAPPGRAKIYFLV
jgi:hypothetical protein